MHYTRVVCWRLLGCLPPSVAYMKLLEGQHNETERALTQSEVLHTLRWVPRMGSEKFKPWIKVGRKGHTPLFKFKNRSDKSGIDTDRFSDKKTESLLSPSV